VNQLPPEYRGVPSTRVRDGNTLFDSKTEHSFHKWLEWMEGTKPTHHPGRFGPRGAAYEPDEYTWNPRHRMGTYWETKPWFYEGWLLAHVDIVDRWLFKMETIRDTEPEVALALVPWATWMLFPRVWLLNLARGSRGWRVVVGAMEFRSGVPVRYVVKRSEPWPG
jgi:hypothetical protein